MVSYCIHWSAFCFSPLNIMLYINPYLGQRVCSCFKVCDTFRGTASFSVFFQLWTERPALRVFLCTSLVELFLRYLFPPFLCHHMNPHFPIGTRLIVTIGLPQKHENFPVSWYSSYNKIRTHTCLVYAKVLKRLFIFNALFQQRIYSYPYIPYSIDNICIFIWLKIKNLQKGSGKYASHSFCLAPASSPSP